LPSHRYARLLGLALTLLCVLYFLQSLTAIHLEPFQTLPAHGLATTVGFSIASYTLLLVGVSAGFAHLVQAAGHRSAATSEGLIVWGKANLAKYLPGNVLHFAGRQLLGAQHGWPQAKIATASLLEAGLFVLLPALLVALALVTAGDMGLLGDAGWLGFLVAGGAGGLALLLFGARLAPLLPAPVARLLARLELTHPAALVPAVLYFLLFFVGMALIVCWLYRQVSGSADTADLPILVGAFLISWLIGFAIPGAPGGIGVREGTFALLGGLALGHDTLVVVALLMRLVTLVGEGLLFVLALGVSRHGAQIAELASRWTLWCRGRLTTGGVDRPVAISAPSSGRSSSR
jgi:hypothetical protein